MRSWTRRLAAALVSLTLAGCGSPAPGGSAPTPATPPIRIASLKGPTTMGLVKLIADAKADATPRYQVSMHGSADEIVTPLVKGDLDLALLPTNLAAVLYQKTSGGIQLAAVNTLGVLYVVETGDDIDSFADLKGRRIYSTGKGTTPEYALNHLLVGNGLDPATDVQVEYRSESTEVAALLATAEDAVAVLPQPFVTIATAQNPRLRVALDLDEEWRRLNPDSAMVTGVLVVRRAFAEANRDAVNTFLDDHRVSTRFTNDNPEQAAPMIVDLGIVPSTAVAIKAIPECNITYVDGAEAKAMVSDYLAVLHAANPESVGGTLPGDDFYYQA